MDLGLIFFIAVMVFLMWPMVELLSDGGIVKNIGWLIVVTIGCFIFAIFYSMGQPR
jgi:hypothetical protein